MNDSASDLSRKTGGLPELRVRLLEESMVQIYREWTPARRLKAADDQMRFARRLLQGAIAGEHPAWSEEEVKREVARRILGNAG